MTITSTPLPTPSSPYTLPRDIHADRLTATAGGVVYTWKGGFGGIVESRERGIKVGDVRLIGGVLFHACWVRPVGPFCRSRVIWTIPNDHNTADWIRGFKRVLFGVERTTT